MRIRKSLKWILAAVLLLIVAKLAMVIFGGFYHVPRHMGFGFGGHGMRGPNYFGGLHFIWSFVTAVFWLAVILILAGWVMKKSRTRRLNQPILEGSLTCDTYSSYSYQADFLDEWEKNQKMRKEKE